jgi:Flp pilus assembly pilin Flp
LESVQNFHNACVTQLEQEDLQTLRQWKEQQLMTRMEAIIKRAKRTSLGRFACRLLGDETGAVMMEYVIIGSLIAAACVFVVIKFGSTISSRFTGMAEATAGNVAAGEAAMTEATTAAGEATAEGENRRAAMTQEKL